MTDDELYIIYHQTYYYKDGFLYRKSNDTMACCYHKATGYMRVIVPGVGEKRSHRVIFHMHHGYCPKVIDHINRIKTDNRVENLREATHQENARNRDKCSVNTYSKYKGVTYNKNRDNYCWKAYYEKNYKATHLGYFSSEIAAAYAYNIAVIDLYGEFAVLNEFDDVDLARKEYEINKSRMRTKSSNYRGVCYSKAHDKWRCKYFGKYLGLFMTEKEAALRWNEEAMNDITRKVILNEVI